jgi:hypothetical protein
MSEKPNNARRTGPALEKACQFVLWLIPTVEKFPRGEPAFLTLPRPLTGLGRAFAACPSCPYVQYGHAVRAATASPDPS